MYVRLVICVIYLLFTCYCIALSQAYFWTYDVQRGECRLRTEATSSGGYESSLWSVWAWVSELTVFLAVPLVILVFNALVINELRRIDRSPSGSGLSSVAASVSGRPGSLHKPPVGGDTVIVLFDYKSMSG